jgi:hypothetical protein
MTGIDGLVAESDEQMAGPRDHVPLSGVT